MLTSSTFDGDTILPLADVRVQLGLTADDTHHDDAATAARDQAIDWVERYTGHSLQSRSFVWSIDQFASRIPLPRLPVTAVGSVKYYDGDGADITLDADEYTVGNGTLSAVSAFPYANGSPGGVRVTFTAGFASASAIPPTLMAAVRLAMTAMFEDRSTPDLSGAIRCADMLRTPLL